MIVKKEVIDYKYCNAQAEMYGDSLCCSVIAAVIATQEPYKKVHDLFLKHGRKFGGRTQDYITHGILFKLGFSLDKINFKRCTTRKIAEQLDPTCTYIVHVRGHIYCIRNGKVEDWSKGRLHRVNEVYKVTKTN